MSEYKIPETMTITQAAKYLKISRRTIYNWLQDGKIKYRRTVGGSIRVFVESLWADPALAGNSSETEWVAPRKVRRNYEGEVQIDPLS